MIVKEKDIEEQIEIIKRTSKNIETDVKELTSYTKEIGEVLNALSICLNTKSGVSHIKKIANIELDTIPLNQMSENINQLEISYQKIRKDL